MAYDRFDPSDERSRWSGERQPERTHSMGGDWRSARDHPDDRGFFDRASDEVASWFGDDEAERRRREDRMRDQFEGRRDRWSSPERSSSDSRSEQWGAGDRDRFRERGRDYRPMTGDYGRGYSTGPAFASGYDRGGGEWDRDPYRNTGRPRASDWPDQPREADPHYRSMRDRHLTELDRDYDDYRRERQSQFESDFGSWRERRQQKRGLLGQIREHMEVLGNDDEHVGTVDRVAGDRIILTRSDPESGGAHHSISCSDIDRIDGDRVILDCSAGQARDRWRDERSSRALFEREDQGEMGPRMLDRSFEGTYR